MSDTIKHGRDIDEPCIVFADGRSGFKKVKAQMEENLRNYYRDMGI